MFLTRLRLEASDAPDEWIVCAPLVWMDHEFGYLVVPVGTVTDLASIPRGLRDWEIFDPNGRSRRSAVMHDWLYLDGTRGKPYADDFLRSALICEGLSPSAAAAFYFAVKWFGGPAWRSYRAV